MASAAVQRLSCRAPFLRLTLTVSASRSNHMLRETYRRLVARGKPRRKFAIAASQSCSTASQCIRNSVPNRIRRTPKGRRRQSKGKGGHPKPADADGARPHNHLLPTPPIPATTASGSTTGCRSGNHIQECASRTDPVLSHKSRRHPCINHNLRPTPPQCSAHRKH